MKLFTKEELTARIQRFQSFMVKNSFEAAIITFNSDLFYFTGSIQKGLLFIPCQGEALYFVRKNLERAKEESSLEVRPYDISEIQSKLQGLKNISISFDVTTLAELDFFKKKLFTSDLQIKDCSSILAISKMIKTEREIELIKKAAEINVKIMEKIPSFYKKGMKDFEMQAEIEYFAKKELNHHGQFRLRGTNMEGGISLVVTGKDSLKPTYTDFPIGGTSLSPAVAQGASGAVIEKSFVVDFIGAFHGYAADSTRTFFIGKPDNFILEIYLELKNIYEKTAQFIVPGKTAEDVYNFTLSLVKEKKWSEWFMGLSQKVSFIGHGIGCEVNQLPVVAPKQNIEFENNMVIALEPKIFIPDYGIIGLEDTFVLKNSVLTSLTGLSELENFII